MAVISIKQDYRHKTIETGNRKTFYKNNYPDFQSLKKYFCDY